MDPTLLKRLKIRGCFAKSVRCRQNTEKDFPDSNILIYRLGLGNKISLQVGAPGFFHVMVWASLFCNVFRI